MDTSWLRIRRWLLGLLHRASRRNVRAGGFRVWRICATGLSLLANDRDRGGRVFLPSLPPPALPPLLLRRLLRRQLLQRRVLRVVLLRIQALRLRSDLCARTLGASPGPRVGAPR